jgi:uncharacterized phage-associated protein
VKIGTKPRFKGKCKGETMELKYNEKKAVQIVALLLQKNNGAMDMLHLTKLVYLVDREAFMRWGMPLTGDRYASMKRGMVLSTTYDLSKGKFLGRFWDKFISKPDHNYKMTLLADPDIDELSEEDIELIDEIYKNYGNKSTSFLIEEVHHKLPEWVDVGSSSLILPYEKVLEKNGFEGEKLKLILEELEEYSYFEKFSV